MERIKQCYAIIAFLVIFGIVSGKPSGNMKIERQEFDYQQSYIFPEKIIAEPIYHEEVEFTPWAREHMPQIQRFADKLKQEYFEVQNHPDTYPALLPVSYSWQMQGRTQDDLDNMARAMTLQIIDDVHSGKVMKEEMANPSFFVHRAASELTRTYGNQQFTNAHTYGQMVPPQPQSSPQTAEYLEENEDLQQQHESYGMDHFVNTENAHEEGDKVIVFNEKTQRYEYMYLTKAQTESSVSVPVFEDSYFNQNNRGYVQSSARRDDTQYYDNQQKYEEPGVFEYTRSEVERPKSYNLARELEPTRVETIQTTTASYDYYDYTTEQETEPHLLVVNPIYKPTEKSRTGKNNVMSLVPKVQTTTEVSKELFDEDYQESQKHERFDTSNTQKSESDSHVMSFVRNKNNAITFNRDIPTTTKKPESNVMSMLKDKKQEVDMKAIEAIKESVRKLNKQHAENNSEIHFMGMSSKKDEQKNVYQIATSGENLEEENEKNLPKEGRGDSPSYNLGDYSEEEVSVESEPGIGYYPKRTRSTTEKILSYSRYDAPLAPYPTTTTSTTSTTTEKPIVPVYYDAPLAPYPKSYSQLGENHQQSSSATFGTSQNTQFGRESRVDEKHEKIETSEFQVQHSIEYEGQKLVNVAESFRSSANHDVQQEHQQVFAGNSRQESRRTEKEVRNHELTYGKANREDETDLQQQNQEIFTANARQEDRNVEMRNRALTYGKSNTEDEADLQQQHQDIFPIYSRSGNSNPEPVLQQRNKDLLLTYNPQDNRWAERPPEQQHIAPYNNRGHFPEKNAEEEEAEVMQVTSTTSKPGLWRRMKNKVKEIVGG